MSILLCCSWFIHRISENTFTLVSRNAKEYENALLEENEALKLKIREQEQLLLQVSIM